MSRDLWRGLMRRPLASVVAIVLAATILLPVVRWGIVDARWGGDATSCRAPGAGACWAFIGHKLPFILFGLYPANERWRPALAVGLLVLLLATSASPRRWRSSLLAVWVIGLGLALLLLRGGLALRPVATQDWGGLPVTLLLTIVGLALGMPVGIVLALGRRSRNLVTRLVATGIVEGVRGVPLIAVLYFAVLVVPLAMRRGFTPDKLVLAQAAVAVFASAYLAEATRAGLQLVPRARLDAALALGLSWWQSMRLVVLPEALRIVVPSYVSIAVGFFQDTSLIVVIGLFDLLNTARLAAQDPSWLGFYTEAYVFVGAVYFVGSALVSRYGLWLEKQLAQSRPAS